MLRSPWRQPSEAKLAPNVWPAQVMLFFELTEGAERYFTFTCARIVTGLIEIVAV